jgi:small subunit ribosomal protein S8
MTDPIADMLTRIRNAFIIKKKEIVLPYSKIKLEIAKVLEKENWIQRVEVFSPEKDKNKFKQIKITLRYNKEGQSVISHIKRISRPGCRIYFKKDKIKPVLDGRGVNILSTSQGLMTGLQAQEKELGGELICEIW